MNMNTRNIPTPTTRAYRCYYCPEHPGLVTANDKLAMKLEDGSWKCGKCITTDLRKRMYRVLGSDNPKVKEFVEQSQHEVNEWNQYVDRLNQAAGYEVGRRKVWKNPYL